MLPVESARQQRREGPGGNHHDDRHRGEECEQHRERPLSEVECSAASTAFFRQLAVEQRDERRGEGAFGEERSKHVRQAEGNEKGVGRETGAHIGGLQSIAHQREHAAGKRQAADRSERSDEAHG